MATQESGVSPTFIIFFSLNGLLYLDPSSLTFSRFQTKQEHHLSLGHAAKCTMCVFIIPPTLDAECQSPRSHSKVSDRTVCVLPHLPSYSRNVPQRLSTKPLEVKNKICAYTSLVLLGKGFFVLIKCQFCVTAQNHSSSGCNKGRDDCIVCTLNIPVSPAEAALPPVPSPHLCLSYPTAVQTPNRVFYCEASAFPILISVSTVKHSVLSLYCISLLPNIQMFISP